MKKLYGLFVFGLLVTWPGRLLAQVGILEKLTAPTGATTYLRLDPLAGPKPLAQSKELLRSMLTLQPADELRLQRSTTDESGYTHEWHNSITKEFPSSTVSIWYTQKMVSLKLLMGK